MAGKVVITGGLGFLGQLVAKRLVEAGTVRGEVLTELVLVDSFESPLRYEVLKSPLVRVHVCDIRTAPWETLLDVGGMSVFHLAAVMSGQGEADFELCVSVNLQSFMALLERCRLLAEGGAEMINLTFTSTGAVFGPEAVVRDGTKCLPQTTYGSTKAMCELLLNDYSRRGFIDGRGARLPTVVVRPGAPNGATTGCFSGVVREPLNGVDIVLPVSPTLRHACGSTRTVVAAIVALHETPADAIASQLGADRVVNLPSFSATLNDLAAQVAHPPLGPRPPCAACYGRSQRGVGSALRKVVAADGLLPLDKLGKIVTDQADPHLDRIVGSMMNSMESNRADLLGLPTNPDLEGVIRAYVEDFWSPPV